MVNLNKSKFGDAVIVFIFVILILICIIPVLNVFARSLSSPSALIRGEVTIFPIGLNFNAFSMVWSDPKYPRALVFTALLTVACTILSLVLTILCAFPFVYKQLKGRKIINFMLLFCMYFGAGMIPTYLWIKALGMIDTVWALMLPSALSVFNFILMRSFFYGIPDSLRESAEMDGAGPMRVLMQIYLPLSKPVCATIALFYAVGRWNGYGDAMMFIRQARELRPIQYLLYIIQQQLESIDPQYMEDAASSLGMPEGMRTATIVIATVPILIVYPFLQKYFVAGATLGAIKE